MLTRKAPWKTKALDRSGTPAPRIRPPERLTREPDVSRHKLLHDWPRDRALTTKGLSAPTYVVCAAGEPSRVNRY
jgi:hypothetical protein